MGTIEKLTAVVGTLKNLFSDKGELRGFDDWDSLIGCVVTLENIIAEFQTAYTTAGEEKTAEE